MCLVSLLPLGTEYSLFSNRDESMYRPAPILVNKTLNGKPLSFPQDHKGGTWLSHDLEGNIIILLNGAEQKHQRKQRYRKSRGLIVLELISSINVLQAWEKVNLIDIEPFTLIVFLSDERLYQLRWNEKHKTLIELNSNTPQLWLSSTLYDPSELKSTRKRFLQFLKEDYSLTTQNNFHENHIYEKKEAGVIIPGIKTVSISSVYRVGKSINLDYFDIRKL